MKLLIKEAFVINVLNGQVSTKSLLIEDGVIKDIGNTKDLKIDSKTEIIDCRGKYLIPGLFDMHTHVLEHKNSTNCLDDLLKLGITAVRDMGGHADSIAELKVNIKKDLVSSPDIYFVGYTIDGIKESTKDDLTTLKITDTTNLSRVISKMNNYGVDFIKVHSYFPYTRLEELIHISTEKKLDVVGHIPRHLDPITSINLGLKSVEHANSLIESLVTAENNEIKDITQAFGALDSIYIKKLSNTFIENNSAFTPTLHIINKVYQENSDETLRKLGRLMMDRFLQITHSLNENGVMILAGSDDVPIDLTNLNSLHLELQWLVKAGLTPLEALQTATINPSIFMKIDSDYGTIEINKKADIVILNNNPLENISNTLDIYGTIKNGILLK